MDKFVEFTGTPEIAGDPFSTVVMDYFDGNTVKRPLVAESMSFDMPAA